MELLSKDYQPDVISVTQHATKLIYNSNIDTTSVKNVVLIHNQVADYMTFVNGCNSNSFPIVYDFSSEKTELLQLLKEKFTSIQRVAFVFHGSESTRFLDQEYLFTEQDLINPDNFSENLQFMINLANSFHIKNMDFLACNTLQHESWKSYYKILESSTGAVVGASNDLTGNLKYGGDWMMENTQEEVQSIYFTDEIINYQYLLISITLDSVVYDYSGTTASVTGFSNPAPPSWNLIIPNYITVDNITYNVTSIAINAFKSCTSLTAVTIPTSVSIIGSSAFYGCTSLTAVTIPVGVTSIGSSAFYLCTSMTAVTIPVGVTSIAINAFRSCTSLTAVTIPTGVTSIGTQAFQSCTSLTTVTIPTSVTSIGSQAFNLCTSLTAVTIPAGVTSISSAVFTFCHSLTSVTIPTSVTSIGDWAFESCTSLTAVTIPTSVTSIGHSVFKSCTSLAAVTIPVGVTSIGANTFQSCTSLTTVTIPPSVTSIGNSVFNSCTSLAAVTIPSSVTFIGNSVFQSCTSLTTVTIPASVTSIGVDVFHSCLVLISIEVNSNNINYASVDGVLFNKLITTLIKYPAGKTQTTYSIPSSVTSIITNAFQSCTFITSVTIPSSVTSIGNNVFNACLALISIEVNSNNINYASVDGVLFNKLITILMQYPAGKTQTTYSIPSSVTSIGNNAFQLCSITDVTIPGSVTSIGTNVFYKCASLANVNWINPALLTSINSNSFAFCSVIIAVHYIKPENKTSLPNVLINYKYGNSNPTIWFGSLQIIPTIPTISNFLIPVKTYGDIPFTIISPTSNSTGLFTYTSSNTNVATISGNTITIVAAGSSIIEATQNNTGNYTSGTITTIFQVNKLTPTISNFEIPVKTYGNIPFTIISPTSNSTGLFTYTSSNANVATISGNTITIVGAGSSIIEATQDATDVYYSNTIMTNFNISPKTTLITAPISLTKTLGDLSFQLLCSSNNDESTFEYSSSDTNVAIISSSGIVTIIGPGTANLNASQIETTNYTYGSAISILNISKQTTLITIENPIFKTFGDSSFQLVCSSNNDESTFEYSSSDTNVAIISSSGIVTIIGSGTVNLNASQIETTNYTSSFTTSILNISKQTTLITIENPIFKTLGEPSFQLLCSSNNNESLFIYISSNTEVVTISDLGIISIIGTGTSILTISQNESENYASNGSTCSLSIITSDKTYYTINAVFQNVTKQLSGYLEDNSYDFSLPNSNYSRDYLIDSENNSFRGYFAVNSLGIITNIYDLSQQISNYKWKDIFLNSNENITYNSFSETFSNSIIIDTTSNIFFQSLSTQNNQAILFNNSFKTQYVSIDGIVENITEVGINIFVNIIIDTNSIMSTPTTVYLEELNVAITAMLGHFDDMVTPAPFTADAVASINVPVNILQDTFHFQTDSVDLDDIIANDIHYKFVYDPVNKPFGNPDMLVNTEVIQGAIDAGATLNSAPADFLRYIAFKLFGTPLGVDLIANETEILDALSESFTTNLDAKLISIASEGVLDRSVIVNNPSKKIMDTLTLTQPGRFINILQYAVDGEPSWFKAPLAVGDIVYMQVVINPATDQHLLTNLPSAILARSYNLKLIASAAVVA